MKSVFIYLIAGEAVEEKDNCRGTLKAATQNLYAHFQVPARKLFYSLISRAERFERAYYDCLTDRWTLVTWCGSDAVSRPPAHTSQVGCVKK